MFSFKFERLDFMIFNQIKSEFGEIRPVEAQHHLARN